MSFAEQSVKDLAFLTGSWSGKIGPSTIEEIWSKPTANAIQASVRIIADGKTSVHEFIVISQVGDEIELSLQQWGPGYVEMAPVTKMKLTELTENSISFKADESASITNLRYTRVAEDAFQIAVTSKGSPEFVIDLKPLE